MKILDWYILKRYFISFFMIIFLFIPIGIMIDLAEKIDRMKENEVPTSLIVNYYIDFMWYFGYLLFPIFLFLSTIWFTSKLANNTEVIAMLSSGISFNRFLRPYLIGALVICLGSFLAGMFIIPKSNEGYQDFESTYLSMSKRILKGYEFHKRINENEYVYVSYYDPNNKVGKDFTLEHFEGIDLKFKIMANNMQWIEKDSIFRLTGYRKRIFDKENEIYQTANRLDTLFSFDINEFLPVKYKAETLKFKELNDFIKTEKRNGSNFINNYLLVRHKRYSLPLSVFVLTIISVAVAAFKRRGGMGINLTFGIIAGFLFIFFDKIFGVMVLKSNFSPLIGAWGPIFIFVLIAIGLLYYAKK